MQKPIPYSIFKLGRAGSFYVLQTRVIATGKPLAADELTAYQVLHPIETPWFGVRIAKRSKMFLADDAAAALIESGQIQPIPPAPLVPWRQGYDAQRTARYDAKLEAKKTLAGRTGI